MKYRPRIFYSDSDTDLMWDRYQNGESLHAEEDCLAGVNRINTISGSL